MTTERWDWCFSSIPNEEFLVAEQRGILTFDPTTLQEIGDFFFQQGLHSPYLFTQMGIDVLSYHKTTNYIDGKVYRLLIGHSQKTGRPSISTADTTIMISPSMPKDMSVASAVIDSCGFPRIVGARYENGLLTKADVSFSEDEFPRIGNPQSMERYDFETINLGDETERNLKGVGLVTPNMLGKVTHFRMLRFLAGTGPFPYSNRPEIRTPAQDRNFTSHKKGDDMLFGDFDWNIALPTSLRIEDHPDLVPAGSI